MAYVRKTKQGIILSFNKFRTTARRLVMTQNPHHWVPSATARVSSCFPTRLWKLVSSFPIPSAGCSCVGRAVLVVSFTFLRVSEACRFARCSNPHPSHQHALLASTVFTAVDDSVCVCGKLGAGKWEWS